jgi:hypothetical protein
MKRWGMVFLSCVGLWLATNFSLAAQSHTSARGSLVLPYEVSWNKVKLGPGGYRFRVTTLGSGQVMVYVEQGGSSKGGFAAAKRELQQKGTGLSPQLVVEFDTELGPEVREMQLPGINWLLTFRSQRKPKKGEPSPPPERREFIALNFD